jgi:glutamate/tyrosine decarboxylase-like PLP-dependent enzyme
MNQDIHLLKYVWDLASDHYEKARLGVPGKLKKPLEMLETLDLGLKKEPSSNETLIDDMRNYLSETTNTLTPYFQNQLFSGLNPYALAGDWLSSLTNSTMATFEVSPMATLLERKLIEHMIQKIGWKEGDGIMTTGGSNANMIAMLLARNQMFPEIKRKGNSKLTLIIFVSEDAHYSFDKAANQLGIGLENVRKIKTNLHGEMDTTHLEEMIQQSISNGETPFFVGATCGTTVRGSFDPLDRISEIAKQFHLWVHADGAWGGSLLLSSKFRHLLKGIEDVDSMTWDTHKMMGTGLMSSFFLTKHKNQLRLSHNDGGGDYIFHESNLSSWDSGPSSLQCGRRNDAFKVWLAWRSMGDNGFESLINRFFAISELARIKIEKREELELMYQPSSLNICFRYASNQNANEINREIRAQLLSEGNFFINIASKDGNTFFRLIIVHPDLTEQHLDELFDSIIRLGKKISKIVNTSPLNELVGSKR